jgi:hypothetical protein
LQAKQQQANPAAVKERKAGIHRVAKREQRDGILHGFPAWQGVGSMAGDNLELPHAATPRARFAHEKRTQGRSFIP